MKQGLANKWLTKDLNRWVYWLLGLLVVATRVVVAWSQRVYLLPEGAGLDDMLMVRAAQQVVAGNWMGPYGGAAIAKNMGYALWLALLHTLHLPLLLANAALWLAACGFAVWALRPVLRGNLARLCAFAFFSFQPVSFAAFNQRAYRDAIFPSFCLLFFAGLVGLGLRLRTKRAGKAAVCAAGSGLGLAGAWLLREDGAALLPFALCGGLAILLFLWFDKNAKQRFAKTLCVLLPFALLAGGVLGFSAVNQAHYGVFMVNDLTSGAFPRAYGLLTAVGEAEGGFHQRVPVTQAALETMYAEIPSLEKLRPSLSSGAAHNGFSDPDTGEFGGSFYYALRLAAGYEGLTPDAAAAQAFWEGMAAETEAAIAEGRLKSAKPGKSTLPRWNAALLGPAAAETGAGAWKLLTFGDCDPRPMESIGPQEKIDEVAAWLRSPIQQGYVAGSDEMYLNPVQKAAFLLCDGLIWVYRVLIWPLLALALYAMGSLLTRGCKALFRDKRWDTALLAGVLMLGLLLSFLLRLVVVGYMEAAAFGIGTYLMYLSGAMPPLLLLLALAAARWTLLLPAVAKKAKPEPVAVLEPTQNGSPEPEMAPETISAEKEAP